LGSKAIAPEFHDHWAFGLAPSHAQGLIRAFALQAPIEVYATATDRQGAVLGRRDACGAGEPNAAEQAGRLYAHLLRLAKAQALSPGSLLRAVPDQKAMAQFLPHRI
jgi:hypothetical protein